MTSTRYDLYNFEPAESYVIRTVREDCMKTYETGDLDLPFPSGGEPSNLVLSRSYPS